MDGTKSRTYTVVIAVVAAMAMMLVFTGVASADPQTGDGAFLCPVVGSDNMPNVPDHFGEIGDTGKYTFLPGNNQAGEHANINALNPYNPSAGVDSFPKGQGGSSTFSPIWPGDTFN